MILALCEFEHLAGAPEGPEIWVELSEEIDAIQARTPCEDLKCKLTAVASDTVERHEEAIECYGRSMRRGDLDDPLARAYHAILDALVCLVAVRGIDPILKGALLTQLAIVAADMRGAWKCQDR
jgi:hypothetical protein